MRRRHECRCQAASQILAGPVASTEIYRIGPANLVVFCQAQNLQMGAVGPFLHVNNGRQTLTTLIINGTSKFTLWMCQRCSVRSSCTTASGRSRFATGAISTFQLTNLAMFGGSVIYTTENCLDLIEAALAPLDGCQPDITQACFPRKVSANSNAKA